MRLTLAPTLVGIFHSTGSLLQRTVEYLLEADVRHRETRRLEELPDERLLDMGLKKPVAARLVGHREPWG